MYCNFIQSQRGTTFREQNVLLRFIYLNVDVREIKLYLFVYAVSPLHARTIALLVEP